jgi:hypothetical protein
VRRVGGLGFIATIFRPARGFGLLASALLFAVAYNFVALRSVARATDRRLIARGPR